MKLPLNLLKGGLKLAWYAGLAYCGAGAAGPKAAAIAIALGEGVKTAQEISG